MCRHLIETVGFTEGHREKYLKNKDLFMLFSRLNQKFAFEYDDKSNWITILFPIFEKKKR